jgi:hypothetical protein
VTSTIRFLWFFVAVPIRIFPSIRSPGYTVTRVFKQNTDCFQCVGSISGDVFKKFLSLNSTSKWPTKALKPPETSAFKLKSYTNPFFKGFLRNFFVKSNSLKEQLVDIMSYNLMHCSFITNLKGAFLSLYYIGMSAFISKFAACKNILAADGIIIPFGERNFLMQRM